MKISYIFEKILQISFWVIIIQLLALLLSYFWKPIGWIGAGLVNFAPGFRGYSEIGAGAEFLLIVLAFLHVLLGLVHGVGLLFNRKT